MTTSRATSTRYQQQHQRAIAAAASVFAKKGFHGATTQDIANEMGIQQGSLYYYFDSKEAALEEVCLFALRDYLSRMEVLATQPGSITNKLGKAIQSHLASYRTHHEAMKVHNEQRLYLADTRREQLKALGSRYRELLEQLFSAGVKDGSLNPQLDCRFSARSLIGLCNYWGVMLLRDTRLDIEDIGARCLELTLQGSLPPRIEQHL